MYFDLIDLPSVFTPDIARDFVQQIRKGKVECPFTADELIGVLYRAENRHRSLSELIDKRALQAEVKNLDRLVKQARKLLQIWKLLDARTRYEIGHQESSERPFRYIVDAPKHPKVGRLEDRVSDFATNLVDRSGRLALTLESSRVTGNRPECSPALLAFIQIIHDAWVERTGSPETFGSEFRPTIEEDDWEPVSRAAESSSSGRWCY